MNAARQSFLSKPACRERTAPPLVFSIATKELILPVADLLAELDASSTISCDERPGRFELNMIRTCIRNGIGSLLRRRRTEITPFLSWLADHASLFCLSVTDVLRLQDARKLGNTANRALLSEMKARIVVPRAVPPSALERRLCWIVSALRLSSIDATILKIVTRARLSPLFNELGNVTVGRHCDNDCFHCDAIAALSGLSSWSIQERLRPSRPLRQLGLLEDHRGGDFAPSRTVLRVARLSRSGPDGLQREILGHPPCATLEWADFAHMADMRELAFDLLAGAIKCRERGVGLMLYGPPGTGKTEFAKTLAQRLGAAAVFVGETDDENGEPTRTDRIGHFALVGALAGRAGRTLVVVDEADDIFTGVDDGDHSSRTGSKVFMNRLVEGCAAPTIWITNHPERLGPAVLRRMTLAVRFGTPGPKLRRDLLLRIAGRRKLELAPGDLDLLTETETSPALLEAGLRGASLTGQGARTAHRCIESLKTAMTGLARPLQAPSGIVFDPDLSSASCDLGDIACRAAAQFKSGQRSLSFCLHGLPGTGKSAYARYLAKLLGLEILEKRASDLLSMFLGGSEKNIAAAFREAEDRGALLIIDEADSLLQNRTRAIRSWEVTQVNEMLTWMESHPLPFVCTTNAMEALDLATLRRFLFKIEFLAMTAAQARLAFRRSFGAEAPATIEQVALLTPADFALVARKAKVLGTTEPKALVEMLSAEVAAKSMGRSSQIGFFA